MFQIGSQLKKIEVDTRALIKTIGDDRTYNGFLTINHTTFLFELFFTSPCEGSPKEKLSGKKELVRSECILLLKKNSSVIRLTDTEYNFFVKILSIYIENFYRKEAFPETLLYPARFCVILNQPKFDCHIFLL